MSVVALELSFLMSNLFMIFNVFSFYLTFSLSLCRLDLKAKRVILQKEKKNETKFLNST